MVEWVSFGLNVVVPILLGFVAFLSVALYVVVREVPKRIPTKEEMMEMGYTVLNTVVDEKANELGIGELLKGVSSPDGSPVASAGRPPEGLMGKLMWFAEHTEIGRQLASRLIGGLGGEGGSGDAPGYYG